MACPVRLFHLAVLFIIIKVYRIMCETIKENALNDAKEVVLCVHLTLCDPMNCTPTTYLSPWGFSGQE